MHLHHRFTPMYDAMYNMALAEDNIWPEKYKVEGSPTLHQFPREHPNRRPKPVERDEL